MSVRHIISGVYCIGSAVDSNFDASAPYTSAACVETGCLLKTVAAQSVGTQFLKRSTVQNCEIPFTYDIEFYSRLYLKYYDELSSVFGL
jgi:hypothetical protein